MNVLEKILEEMLNYERVVKTDEDLEWNRAMYKCSEIIRSHMVEKEKVSSAEIISRNIDGKPYCEIKYQKVGEGHYTVGYSSYKLNFVVEWLNKYFEFCGEVKVSVVDDKDTNIHDNDEIEPVWVVDHLLGEKLEAIGGCSVQKERDKDTGETRYVWES